jgi:hypothetical protein
MGTKRGRKPDDLTVPEISDDAAERKRVLNVLAQRRYSELLNHEQSTLLAVRRLKCMHRGTKERTSRRARGSSE